MLPDSCLFSNFQLPEWPPPNPCWGWHSAVCWNPRTPAFWFPSLFLQRRRCEERQCPSNAVSRLQTSVTGKGIHPAEVSLKIWILSSCDGCHRWAKCREIHFDFRSKPPVYEFSLSLQLTYYFSLRGLARGGAVLFKRRQLITVFQSYSWDFWVPSLLNVTAGHLWVVVEVLTLQNLSIGKAIVLLVSLWRQDPCATPLTPSTHLTAPTLQKPGQWTDTA